MEDLASFMPKSRMVVVGRDELTLKEFTVAKRDAVVKVLLANLDAAKMVGPFMEAFRNNKRANAKMMAEMAGASTTMKAAGKTDEEIQARLAEIMGEYRMKAAEEDEFDIGSVAGQIKDLVLKLLSNDLTLVSCIALDVLENRQKIDADNKTTVDKKNGYEYSEKMFNWVKGNLTMPQEQQVLAMIVEVNDVVGLVKNYWTPVSNLLGKMNEEAGEATEKTATE